MNTSSRLLLATSLTCSLLLLSGCGPNTVQPYAGGTGEGVESDSMSGTGTNQMGTITEEIINPGTENLSGTGGLQGTEDWPETESLDSTGQGAGSLAGSSGAQDDVYKREHGRCTPEFKPVYFDHDQSGIKTDQIPAIEHNATYLRNNSFTRVLIEGNTDSTGTNEYNLALGERRAMSAKNYLRELGIDESRILTISYGEEQPLFNGQNEGDYLHNRRDDFILE